MTARNGSGRTGLGSRFFFGALVLAIGILFLLNSTGVADLDRLLDWWPLLIILYGAWRLIANRFRRLFFPILLIAIGAILQLGQLGFDIDFGRLWPIALIAVGVLILAGGIRRRNRRGRSSAASHGSSTIIDVDVSASGNMDDAALHAIVGTQDRIISGDLQSASVNVVMGSGSLDLRDAKIVDKPATLEVSTVMGEVKVRVPTEWNVRIENFVTMGDAKDARRSPPDNGDTPDLIVSGSVTMGSLQITD